jgi:hypothetical protein
MNYNVLRNSIRPIIREVRDGDKGIIDATEEIVNIFMVETWNHTAAETLYLDDLTDSEYRILSMWARRASEDYTSRIAAIKDMRETFPGLGITAAYHFCLLTGRL